MAGGLDTKRHISFSNVNFNEIIGNGPHFSTSATNANPTHIISMIIAGPV